MDIETARWLVSGSGAIIITLIGFIVVRLFKEVDKHRTKLHDQQNEIIKTNAQVSVLKELFISIFRRKGGE